jgi:hypothetical protein
MRMCGQEFKLRPTHPYISQGVMTEGSNDITNASKASNRQRFETDLEVRMDGETSRMA